MGRWKGAGKEKTTMGRYIVLYHAPKSAVAAMSESTPEEMQKGMALWMGWAEKCGEGLVDMGSPLGGGQRMTASGAGQSDSEVTGYSILEAESMEAAKALLEGHPHVGWDPGCAIEVHEAIPLPM